jgi:hypothetical protein
MICPICGGEIFDVEAHTDWGLTHYRTCADCGWTWEIEDIKPKKKKTKKNKEGDN